MGGGKAHRKKKERKKKRNQDDPAAPSSFNTKTTQEQIPPRSIRSTSARVHPDGAPRSPPKKQTNKQTNPKRHSAFLLPLLVLHLTSVRCRKHPCPSPPSLPGGGSPPSQQTERLTKRISIPHRWRRSPDRLEEGKKQTGLSGSMARLRIQEPQQQLKKNKK